MDAHSFRVLAATLIPLLQGARLDKIYGPLPDLTVFHCFGKTGKFTFAVQSQRQQPRYFLQSSPLPNPQTPSPAIMRLRKYLINAHFGEGIPEIVTRSLALPIIRHGETVCWLLCSPSQGISLHHALPKLFPTSPAWPEQEILETLHNPQQLEDPAIWLAYPVLTPLLRKTLTLLDKPEAMALLVDLEAGGDDLFFYGPSSGRPNDGLVGSSHESTRPSHYFAWPLPEALCEEQQLIPLAPFDSLAPEVRAHLAPLPTFGEGAVPLSLQLASFVDEQALQASFTTHLTKDDKQDAKRVLKRARRKERALEQEAQRLEKMVVRQKDARLIQENLWRLDPGAKYDNITLGTTLPTGETVTRTISLDPRLTIRENMLELFKKAEKGKRGLAIIGSRQQAHASQPLQPSHFSNSPKFLDTLNTSALASETSSTAEKIFPRQETKQPLSFLQNWGSLIEQDMKYPQKNVAAFKSSDGYTLLRGKNAQGNKQILKLSKAHDLWLHVQGGPSAHVIIKRHHAQDQVPESTIIEAARLVAEKSWLKENDSAEIMLALVKNVQSIKGAAAGTVKVDKLLRTVYIKRPSPSETE